MHFEFVSEDVWGRFNQKVAELKGYPLFEAKEQTSYQKRQTGRAKESTKSNTDTDSQPYAKQEVLFEINL